MYMYTNIYIYGIFPDQGMSYIHLVGKLNSYLAPPWLWNNRPSHLKRQSVAPSIPVSSVPCLRKFVTSFQLS